MSNKTAIPQQDIADMAKINKSIKNSEASHKKSGLPYTHCLNCGAKLKGTYCHNCGQEAVSKTPTVWSFIIEYINDTYNWDSNFLKTLWCLVRRPGHLTNEFLAGKIVSHVNPLKLNLFLLFVFITLFLLFASPEKMKSSVYDLTSDERVFSEVQLTILADNPEFVKKMEESQRDTIHLQAPLHLAEKYPQFIKCIEVKENTEVDALDKWVALVPQVLIEDDIIVMKDDDEYYHFNTESEIGREEKVLFNSIWEEIVNILTQYFPILLLLTTPLLSFALRIIQYRCKIPRINHFIFALHYTAFLEFLIICIYILYLSIAPPVDLLENILSIGSCTYLAIAFRNVYTTNSWLKAIIKSLLFSVIYFTILLMIFVAICIIACIAIAINMD